MQIAVLGVNHKVAGVNLRELIAKALLRRFSYGEPQVLENASFVVLSTCNRSEIYFSSNDLAHTHQEALAILREEIDCDFEQKCYSFFRKDCLQHLSRVTAGLDSAVIAETEIQGQVRLAYELATTARLLPSTLHFLFQKALKIGKEIRTKFLYQKEIPDIEHAIYAKIKEHFQATKQPMLFIGASSINLKIAHFLANKGYTDITFTNRSPYALQKLKNRFKTMSLNDFYNDWNHYNCIIAATKCPHYLISEELYSKYPQKRLLIDLAVPRNIDPAIGSDIINIDSLQEFLVERKNSLQEAVIAAELFIRSTTDRLIERKLRGAQISCVSYCA